MATINSNYNKLAAGYLFPEIARRTRAFLEKNPGVKVMRLGIGNTTEPLTPSVIKGLFSGVEKLASVDTYTGYGDEQGDARLREALKKQYAGLGVNLDIGEIFVSDGAKPDSGNIQSIFGQDNIIAVQDPAYPVYVDTNVIAGRTGFFNKQRGLYDGIVYMPCTEANGFFSPVPDQKVDLIYICSPNNPTGTVATKEQLKTFVDYARRNKAVIIFDAAYSAFIKDDSLPKSIFQIDGAAECALEINSFSKIAGFTGVRLGWAVVPKALTVENSEPGKINALWNRRQSTFFNGASNIVQEGGLAALSEQGAKECRGLIDYYMDNALIIKNGLTEIGIRVFGGDNGPYIWMQTLNGMNSWDFFDKLITETHVVGTPGSGFGPSGEGYFRLSSFGHKQDIINAVDSIKQNLVI
ncbi:LL-diaminopimelate aminotransferase [candidate division KSB1 bacterium]|nr:LL-diaminopimelate aminotransferase [candidate division KSB1 bacterium]